MEHLPPCGTSRCPLNGFADFLQRRGPGVLRHREKFLLRPGDQAHDMRGDGRLMICTDKTKNNPSA